MSRIVEMILLLIGYETTRQQIERARALFPFIGLILFFPPFFFFSFVPSGRACERWICVRMHRRSANLEKRWKKWTRETGNI